VYQNLNPRLNLTNLIIDIGNTRIKTALFQEDSLIEEVGFEALDELISYSSNLEFSHAIISSVKYSENELKALIPFGFLFLERNTPVPIQNLYKSPETLGVDRKAAVIGARTKVKKGPVLAIDLGSCITYEILDEGDNYHGGAISPGLTMRFKAMNQQTARLPLVSLEANMEPKLTGDTTVSCMQSGVYSGILFEIKGFIQAYQEKYRDLKVIICGGDSKIFESLTKDHIFVIPNLVLYGLNRILSYNVNFQ
jgi:type III pantothenate kinase